MPDGQRTKSDWRKKGKIKKQRCRVTPSDTQGIQQTNPLKGIFILIGSWKMTLPGHVWKKNIGQCDSRVFPPSTDTGTKVLLDGCRRNKERLEKMQWQGMERDEQVPLGTGCMEQWKAITLLCSLHPPLLPHTCTERSQTLRSMGTSVHLHVYRTYHEWYKHSNCFQVFLRAAQILSLYYFRGTVKAVVSYQIYIKAEKFFMPQQRGQRGNSSQCPHQLHISPLLSSSLPPCLQPFCSKEKVTEIFEIIKGFGWVNLEWVKLLEKNLKDRSGMQSCYINIFWMVPSYTQPWRHNCIKWNFIQKLWKCTRAGWLSPLSVPF